MASNIVVRFWLVSVVVVLISACAKEGGDAPQDTGQARPEQSVTSSTTGAPPSEAGSRGIAVLQCSSLPESEMYTPQITFYDPATGQQGETRTFPPGDSRPTVCAQSGRITDNGPLRRNQFNADYSALAASRTGDDGGSHVGYIDVSGNFTDLTASKGVGYGSQVPDQSRPVFNPATGRLWFIDGNPRTHPITGQKDLGSVDPAAGITSSRPEPGTRLFSDAFDFSADGRTVIDGSGASSLNGKFWVLSTSCAGCEWRLSDRSDNANEAPQLALPASAPAPGCDPRQFIDETSFLCVGDGTQGSPHGLYTMTLDRNRKALSQRALLPASSNAIVDVVVARGRSEVAFIALDTGARTSLFVASTTTSAEPRKVADLDADLTGDLNGNKLLAGWD